MKEFIIDKTNEKQRFDKYLRRIMPEASNSFIYKMLRKKNIELNSKRAKGDEILKAGDSVKIFLADDTFFKMSNAKSYDVSVYEKAYSELKNIYIVYEHSDFLICYKPSGVLSQMDDSNKPSLNEWVIGYLLKSGFTDEKSLNTFKPSVLNRLDMNTKGLVLAGKTLKGSQRISEMLNKRTLHKYYLTTVGGNCDLNGDYFGFAVKNKKNNLVTIYSDENKIPPDAKYSPIKTGVKVLSFDNKKSLLQIELYTGKSHQIRAHLSFLGYPIKGDYKYGYKNIDDENAKYQDLTAYKIVFPQIDDNDDWNDLSRKEFELKFND